MAAMHTLGQAGGQFDLNLVLKGNFMESIMEQVHPLGSMNEFSPLKLKYIYCVQVLYEQRCGLESHDVDLNQTRVTNLMTLDSTGQNQTLTTRLGL